jgi:hypothetical protein
MYWFVFDMVRPVTTDPLRKQLSIETVTHLIVNKTLGDD